MSDMTPASHNGAAPLDDRRSSARRPPTHAANGLIRGFFLAGGGVSIVISGAIVLSLIGNAASFLIQVDKSALFTDGWFPRRGMYDIRTILAGTLVISRHRDGGRRAARARRRDLPVRVRTPRVRKLLKPIHRDPGLDPERRARLLRPHLAQPERRAAADRIARSRTWLVAGLAVGVLITPLVASICEDSLHAVPQLPARGRLRPRRPEADDQPERRRARGGVRDRRGDAARRSRAPSARR